MQARVSRRRLAVFTTLGVWLSGCVTVHGVERGELIGKEQFGEDHRDRHELGVSDDTAYVQVKRTTCETFRNTYEEIELQRVRSPSYPHLVGGLAMAAAGVGLTYVALTSDGPLYDGAGRWIILGIPFMLTGSGLAISSPKQSGAKTESRRVTLASTQWDTSEECRDSQFRLKSELPWTVRHGSATRSGKTGPDGALALRPPVRQLLAELPPKQMVATFVSGGTLPFDVTLGDAPRKSVRMDGSAVTDTLWEGWAKDHGRDLPPADRLVWDACVEVSRDARAAFACQHKPDGGPVQSLSGTLSSSGGGEYGALHELEGRRGERLNVRLLLPGEDVDWLVQVVALDTGEVVTESFSGKPARHDVTATLPRAGRYALVLNALRPGAYRTVITRRSP